MYKVTHEDQTSRGSKVVTETIDADDYHQSNMFMPVWKFTKAGRHVVTLAVSLVKKIEEVQVKK